jgi:hypothetical protein
LNTFPLCQILNQDVMPLQQAISRAEISRASARSIHLNTIKYITLDFLAFLDFRSLTIFSFHSQFKRKFFSGNSLCQSPSVFIIRARRMKAGEKGKQRLLEEIPGAESSSSNKGTSKASEKNKEEKGKEIIGTVLGFQLRIHVIEARDLKGRYHHEHYIIKSKLYCIHFTIYSLNNSVLRKKYIERYCHFCNVLSVIRASVSDCIFLRVVIAYFRY